VPVIRFGLIGAGVAAETHARELKRVNGACLESVFARDQEKAKTFAARFGVPRSYSDYADFLADAFTDALIVATPNGLHQDYAVQAARAGKHVVVEKPLEITEKRAQAIIDACREADRRLFVVYQRRYSNAARQALSDIKAGRLGQVVLVNIVDNQFRHPSYYSKDAWRGTWALEGGGCVMTQSTHLIDLAQFVVGPIVRVFQRHLLTISGTGGSIILNGEHDQVVFRQTVEGLPAAAIPSGFSFADPTDPRKYPTEGQRRQLQAVVNELFDHHESDSTGENALRSVRVIDAIYRSAREGKPIEVERHADLDVIGTSRPEQAMPPGKGVM
jgi:predicted dehydrogenase